MNGPAALVAVLMLTACAGPTATIQPTNGSTLQPTSQPTSTSQPTPTLQPTPAPISTDTPEPSNPGTTPAPSEPSILSAWAKRSDIASGPSAREDHTWTVNGDGTIAYLFGGRGDDRGSDELWAFDLATDTWSQLTQTGDSPTPAARFGHTSTWVPDVGLVIWSGEGGVGFFDDIWAYDPLGNVWRELPSLGAVPAARYGSCASLGPDGELWISHGFTEDSGRFSDTRSYDFATGAWTDRTPAGQVPVERCLHDCFWSSATGQLVLYGGQTTGVAALGDIWAYDPSTGAWTRGPDSEAPPRQLYSLSTSATGAVVFGGGSLDGGFLNDSWQIGPGLDLVPLEDGATHPPARSGATLINDTVRGRYLLFGGKNVDGVLGDTWELGPSS